MKTNNLIELLSKVKDNSHYLDDRLKKILDTALEEFGTGGEAVCLFPFYKEDSESFCEEEALAYLLSEEVVFCNSRKFVGYGGKVEEETIVIFVILNDTFYYASADAEPIRLSELQNLYELYKEHKYTGIVKWATEKRGILPISHYRRQLREADLWSLEMQILENREHLEKLE